MSESAFLRRGRWVVALLLALGVVIVIAYDPIVLAYTRLGPGVVDVSLVAIAGIAGIAAFLYFVFKLLMFLGWTFRGLLAHMLVGVAALSILVLAASWVPELHLMPAAPRDGEALVHQGVHLINLVWQLTGGWDWERLRSAATVWVAVTGLGLWTASKLPIPILSASSAVAVMGLVVLQYGAVGGGQPVWALEHLVVHLMELAGFKPDDITAFKHFARENFAAHAPFRSISLQSQGLLGTIALVLAIGITFVFGPSSAIVESQS